MTPLCATHAGAKEQQDNISPFSYRLFFVKPVAVCMCSHLICCLSLYLSYRLTEITIVSICLPQRQIARRYSSRGELPPYAQIFALLAITTIRLLLIFYGFSFVFINTCKNIYFYNLKSRIRET